MSGRAASRATFKPSYGGKAGTASMNGYSLGGYWTHTGLSGWYVDAVLHSTWYDGIRANSVLGESLRSKGWGGAASLEAGYPIKMSGGWTIEPQAQLIYQRVSLDDGADRFGMVDYKDADAVYGRLGGRLVKTWSTDDGWPITTWARANIWHSFGAQATTTFANLAGGNPVALNTDLGGTWGQIGLGASGQVTRNVSVLATADYNFALGSGRGQGIAGRAGLKVAW
ncbi:autotransporter outer membrane beta-barrel domain-containing protein [Mesorhizobium sp.]|uniref:autotransporter domain-containing protein n=1 Tax=Mesorhizobium sp. TaxID=1871066 RepID=UPI000FE6E75F|nr:autotransporter outer membrane beta-barrel domain-containing protein [Mesorhizobium sp.]RWI89889.1 MAG: autotransporter domain-containing protein [Mesorhizobium sp.]